MSSVQICQPMTVLDALDRASSISMDRIQRSTTNTSWNGLTAPNLAADFSRVELAQASSTEEADPELKLPPMRSLLVLLIGAALFQIAFFILIPSSAAYTQHLGGSATFSGLVIGIPVVFGGMLLVPMTKMDRGTYRWPMYIQIGSMIVGSILYAIAYKANFLYLLLISRMIQGFGFTSFMYAKRYITDSRIVGLRRRTQLASFLVITQCTGFSAGPFIGGVLFKIGFPNDVWNAYTSPGWFMAGIWTVYWIAAAIFFEDVEPLPRPTKAAASISENAEAIEMHDLPVHPEDSKNASITTAITSSHEVTPTFHIDSHSPVRPMKHHLGFRGWGTLVCMCWFAMTCFLILGAFEANIPIFTAKTFGYSPYASGNFIALGGAVTFPLLFLNVLYARRIQDRIILAAGSTFGLVGVLLFLIQLSVPHYTKISLPGYFICWCLVALGFNLACTCTMALLSKQMPPEWNGKLSMAIQYSNYTGRIVGAVLGGSGVKIGMQKFLGVQIVVVGIGAAMYLTLWKELKTKTG